MKIQIRVVPRAKRVGVDVLADGMLKVRVAAPAEDGRANEAVLAAIAEYYGVGKRAVTIVRGMTSRTKWIEVMGR